jgi:predicted enzyme related to lactoylglutathione lyase
MGQKVVHVEVLGSDGERLRQFYGSLFGWSFDTDSAMGYGVVKPEDAGVGGGVGSSPEGYAGHVTFYVAVADVEAALQEAERLGGRRLMGPHEVMENVEIGQFADPDGHLVGVIRGGE